jgi:hypothetical protein
MSAAAIKALKIAAALLKDKKGRKLLLGIITIPLILIIFLYAVLVYIITTPLSQILKGEDDILGIGNFKSQDEILQYSAVENYSKIKYTPNIISQGGRNIVYFNQNDKPWKDMLYGFLKPISISGCGPTSMAIVVSTLAGDTLTPAEAADWSYHNGYLDQGFDKYGEAYAQTYHSFIPAIASKYELQCSGISVNSESEIKIREALSNGQLVVAIMGPGHFTSDGHFIVLSGIADNGDILVTDCASRDRTDMTWNINTIVSEANSNAGAGGPFWAIWLESEEEEEDVEAEVEESIDDKETEDKVTKIRPGRYNNADILSE